VNDQTDQQLLRDFAKHRSEAAFTELVRRHVDLVHSAAFRMTDEAHSAQDVTQAVFVCLAQNAGRLHQHPVLSGWLHTTARNLAAKNVRATVRRQNHEQEAAAMNDLPSNAPDASWEEIAPHLDAALGELNECERDAILLRYFEKKSAAEIALRLGTSAEAAQKRVSRGVERLRGIFAKRGVSVGAGGLALVVSAHAVQAAPAGLALTVSTTAITAAALSAPAVIATTQPILMSALQKTVITATVAVVFAGSAIYQAVQNHDLRDQIATLRRRQSALESDSNRPAISDLQAQIEQLSQQNAELNTRLAKANANSTQLNSARQQAERSANLYRQLADQATAKSTTSTNDYPSQRHVFVGFGKLVRQMADLNNQDQSKFTSGEKAANDQMKASLLRDFMSLATLAGQYDNAEKTSGNPATDSADTAADTMTCLLYGAIGLSEQQYGDIYSILQKYQRQGAEQNLFGDPAGPDATSALKQMNDDARKQIEPLLTGDQAKALQEIIPSIQLVTRNLNITFGSK